MSVFIAWMIVIWLLFLPVRIMMRRARRPGAAPVQVIIVQPGSPGATQLPELPGTQLPPPPPVIDVIEGDDPGGYRAEFMRRRLRTAPSRPPGQAAPTQRNADTGALHWTHKEN